MVLLIIYMLGTLGVSFLCSLLESVLMSTPISFVTMKKEQGYKPADKFYKFKSDPDRPLAAILSLNTIGCGGYWPSGYDIVRKRMVRNHFGGYHIARAGVLGDCAENHRNFMLEEPDGIRDIGDFFPDRADVAACHYRSIDYTSVEQR